MIHATGARVVPRSPIDSRTMIVMGRLTSAMAALALAAGACADDAVIVVDVTWSEALAATFAADDQLRIHVGHPATSDSFERSDEAFWEETALSFPGAVRYELRPEGALELVGELQIVASVAGPQALRAFGEAPSMVRFAPGEVRVVPIELDGARAFELNGEGDRCVAWDVDASGEGGVAIGERDNRDCDSFPDDEDCAPFVASDPGDPEICDQLDQACDGAVLTRLPCAFGVDQRVVGVRLCDEGGVGWKACNPDPDAQLPVPLDGAVSQRLAALDGPRDCLHAPDPLRCAGGASADADATCGSDAALGGCEERVALSTLAGSAVKVCRAQIFGGTSHGEWEVGFSESNDPGTLHAVAEDCAASLVIRARSPKLVPRTVLVQAQLGLRTYVGFVRLVPGGDGVCGPPTCQGLFTL